MSTFHQHLARDDNNPGGASYYAFRRIYKVDIDSGLTRNVVLMQWTLGRYREVSTQWDRYKGKAGGTRCSCA